MATAENVLTVQSKLRKKILELHFKANAGHIGCSLSCIDILIAVLIRQKTDKDSFILSKGHAASALYVSLNYIGEIPTEQLSTFYQNGTTLSAHPAPLKYKEIPFATGSLGHGFPVGAGIALADKLAGNGGYSYVVMSDGETNEGTTWEAAHFAVSHKLDNLVVIIDNNGLQGFGNLHEVLGNSAESKKWETLGFDVMAVDGHNIEKIEDAVSTFKQQKNGRPKVIIAKTVKGMGVSYMENQLDWHYLPMTNQQYENAVSEIEKKYSR